jgi:hypothetical protein
MFLWNIRQHHVLEWLGQVIRIVGAASVLPPGNTGGTNVNPFNRMPLQPELAERIDKVRTSGR